MKSDLTGLLLDELGERIRDPEARKDLSPKELVDLLKRLDALKVERQEKGVADLSDEAVIQEAARLGFSPRTLADGWMKDHPDALTDAYRRLGVDVPVEARPADDDRPPLSDDDAPAKETVITFGE